MKIESGLKITTRNPVGTQISYLVTYRIDDEVIKMKVYGIDDEEAEKNGIDELKETYFIDEYEIITIKPLYLM